MAQTAVAVPEVFVPPVMRRFEVADLSRHGLWITPRLVQAYPHLNERAVAGWLRALIESREFLFLYQEHGVALAQVMSAYTLAPKPVVQERFVWIEDRADKAQQANAAEFYVEFARWAKNQGAETLLVEEMSDVPHELVREKLGRIFTRQQQFARV